MKLVSGNSNRIFLNTSIGCSSNCSYCYLKKKTSEITTFSANTVLEQLYNYRKFVPGIEGSILSIGCYSECFDPYNIDETKELVSQLTRFGNRIQLATKRRIPPEVISLFDKSSTYKYQIIMNISIPTISYWKEIEKGTDSPTGRIENFENIKNTNILPVLYLKPVIQGITIKDLDQYESIMRAYNTVCVVGNYFDTIPTEISVLVGEDTYFEKKSSEAEEIKERLSKIGMVFDHSTDVICKWKLF